MVEIKQTKVDDALDGIYKSIKGLPHPISIALLETVKMDVMLNGMIDLDGLIERRKIAKELDNG